MVQLDAWSCEYAAPDQCPCGQSGMSKADEQLYHRTSSQPAEMSEPLLQDWRLIDGLNVRVNTAHFFHIAAMPVSSDAKGGSIPAPILSQKAIFRGWV